MAQGDQPGRARRSRAGRRQLRRARDLPAGRPPPGRPAGRRSGAGRGPSGASTDGSAPPDVGRTAGGPTRRHSRRRGPRCRPRGIRTSRAYSRTHGTVRPRREQQQSVAAQRLGRPNRTAAAQTQTSQRWISSRCRREIPTASPLSVRPAGDVRPGAGAREGQPAVHRAPPGRRPGSGSGGARGQGRADRQHEEQRRGPAGQRDQDQTGRALGLPDRPAVQPGRARRGTRPGRPRTARSSPGRPPDQCGRRQGQAPARAASSASRSPSSLATDPAAARDAAGASHAAVQVGRAESDREGVPDDDARPGVRGAAGRGRRRPQRRRRRRWPR